MPKKTMTLECNDCLNSCTIRGNNIDSVQFCPFCGEGVSMIYDSIDEQQLFGGTDGYFSADVFPLDDDGVDE